MNRKIKFRGKNYENKWKYGDLVQEKWGQGKAIMIKKDTTAWSVLEDTVGQYTGLDDKNGKEIYEGDIVKYRDSTGQHIEKVIFDKGCFYAGMHGGSSTRVAPKLINTRITEVIGNIYDNPELLGGEDER